MAFCGGDIEGYWKLDEEMQLDALAYWHLRHAVEPQDTHASEDYEPSDEDVRLMLSSPASAGDLAWLYGKMNKPANRELPDWYDDPGYRDSETQAAVESLFKVH